MFPPANEELSSTEPIPAISDEQQHNMDFTFKHQETPEFNNSVVEAEELNPSFGREDSAELVHHEEKDFEDIKE